MTTTVVFILIQMEYQSTLQGNCNEANTSEQVHSTINDGRLWRILSFAGSAQ